VEQSLGEATLGEQEVSELATIRAIEANAL
jgi:hypothetical protein